MIVSPPLKTHSYISKEYGLFGRDVFRLVDFETTQNQNFLK